MIQNREEAMVYIEKYEQLLRWYFDNENVRQIKLFKELKKQYFAHSPTGIKDGFCSLNGLCVGRITSSDLSYQYVLPSFVCNRKSIDISNDTLKDYNTTEVDNPICAAVNEVHLFHFGNILKELAYIFYILPDPICRSHYMVHLLETYCDVLRQTFEMLDFDWKSEFENFNLIEVMKQFYYYIPHAIVDSIIVQMKLTNDKELHDICTNKIKPLQLKDYSLEHEDVATLVSSKFIPLSIDRLQYLIGMLDMIYKAI